MNTDDYKKKLEEEKARLEESMQSVAKPNPQVPGDWEPVPTETGSEPDVVDQADVTVSRENNTAILAELEARYDNVLAALARIEKGTYGTCDVCGKEIEEARLDADPAATTCTEHING